MPKVNTVPGQERPLPVLSDARFTVALTGMIQNDDGVMVPYSTLAEFPVTEDNCKFQLGVPHTGFMLYEINIQRHLIPPTTPEVELARLIITAVSPDVWDACAAALQAKSKGSLDTVFHILFQWGRQMLELYKPLEPDSPAGLESEEER